MKQEYLEPIVKIFLCEKEDVITTSVTVDGDDNVVAWPGTVIYGTMKEGLLK